MGRIKSDISGKKRYPNLSSKSNLQHTQQQNHECGCFNPSGAGLSASSLHSLDPWRRAWSSLPTTLEARLDTTVKDPSSEQGWIRLLFHTAAQGSLRALLGSAASDPFRQGVPQVEKNKQMPKSSSLPVHMKGKH